jgi:transposase
MANEIKMDLQTTIRNLFSRGWTLRRIARELRLHRNTVRRYAGVADTPVGGAPPALAISGAPPAKCTISTAGKTAPGRPASCAQHAAAIAAGLEAGLSAQRIWQDLQGGHGFPGSYESVKRFVRRLRARTPRVFERMECEPGEEVQVDFGTGAWIVDAQGRRRRSWVFRATLSHSRKGYSEAVFRQDAQTFVRCLENAFRHFGGVPRSVVPDNLKAAVVQADWYDPEIHPLLRDFAAHYGTVILPTRPRLPHHKGKVERGVGYVKGNALKGRTFASLAAENDHLEAWERDVADLRIHGTTRRQVRALFEASERPALGPLPPMLFPVFREGRRKVHRDGFVEVEKAFYHAPPECLGRTLWVRWDSRTVRLLNDRLEQLVVHPRGEPGAFVRREPASGRAVSSLHRNRTWLLAEARGHGYWCGQWAETLLLRRGDEALRTLFGLRGLARRTAPETLDRACEQAVTRGVFRLRDLRRLTGAPPLPQQSWLPLLENHRLIRGLDTYQAVLSTPTPKENPP